MFENLEAYKAGEHLPHIITKPFMGYLQLV